MWLAGYNLRFSMCRQTANYHARAAKFSQEHTGKGGGGEGGEVQVITIQIVLQPWHVGLLRFDES